MTADQDESLIYGSVANIHKIREKCIVSSGSDHSFIDVGRRPLEPIVITMLRQEHPTLACIKPINDFKLILHRLLSRGHTCDARLVLLEGAQDKLESLRRLGESLGFGSSVKLAWSLLKDMKIWLTGVGFNPARTEGQRLDAFWLQFHGVFRHHNIAGSLANGIAKDAGQLAYAGHVNVPNT